MIFAHGMRAMLSCRVQKFCSNHYIRMLVKINWNFNQIWIVTEKSLLKWIPKLLLPFVRSRIAPDSAHLLNYCLTLASTKLKGGILVSPCPSVCPSVCPLTFRVSPVASTVQDGFFPYLVQMINSMRGCVTWDDPWPWPISSR